MTTSNPSSSTSHSKNVFRLHGVNVLNRKNVDSIARLTALERRRTTHILDERQRRDTMNQLLTELASLVRESAAEGDTFQQQQQQQLQQQLQQQAKAQTSSTPIPNADGTGKRPPVKSNSITTLRNAIAEIRRLRAHIDLQALNDPNSNGSNHTFPPPRRPSTRSTSPSLSEYSSLSTLATLATQHRDNLDSNSGSCSSTPMSSPRPASQRALSPVESSEVTLVDVTALPLTQTSQLNSPPLSPSSPLSQSNPFSAVPLSNMVTHQTTYQHHQQGLTLPPLLTFVSPNSGTSSSFHSQNPYYQPLSQVTSNHTAFEYGLHSEMSTRPSSPIFATTLPPASSFPDPFYQYPVESLTATTTITTTTTSSSSSSTPSPSSPSTIS